MNKMVYYLSLILFSSCSTKSSIVKEHNNFGQKEMVSQLDLNILTSLELSQDSFLVGDDINLYFVITNLADHGIYVNNSPYGGIFYKGQKTSLTGFEVTIETKDGEILDPKGLYYIGGRSSVVKVEPKEQLKIRVPVISSYALTKTTGHFKVIVAKKVFIYLNPQEFESCHLETSKDFEKCFHTLRKESIIVNVHNSK